MKARAMAQESATNLAEGKITTATRQTPVYRVGKTDDPVNLLGANELSGGYLGNPGSPARTFIVDPKRSREAEGVFQELFKSEKAYSRRVRLINKILPRVSFSLLTAIPLSFVFHLEPLRSIPGLLWLAALIPPAFFGAMLIHRHLSKKFSEKGKQFQERLEALGAREITEEFINELDSPKGTLRSPGPKRMFEALGIFERIASESRKPRREALENKLKEIASRDDYFTDTEEN